MHRSTRVLLALPIAAFFYALYIHSDVLFFSSWRASPLQRIAQPGNLQGQDEFALERESDFDEFTGKRWAFLRKPKFLFVFVATEGWAWNGNPPPNPLEPHPIVNNCNGPTWVRNLTQTWSSRGSGKTLVANMAVNSAPVSSTITPPGVSTLDLGQQLAIFEKYFTDHEQAVGDGYGRIFDRQSKVKAPWQDDNAVFAFTFGTNDVPLALKALKTSKLSSTFRRIGASYVATLERLYQAGARAFVFSEVLPLDRSPLGLAMESGIGAVEMLGAAVREFNNIVLETNIGKWCHDKAEVRCLILKTYHLATRIMDEPDKYAFKYPFEYCEEYAKRHTVEAELEKDPWCKGPLREYVWRDEIHPSYAFHMFWAELYEEAATELLKTEYAPIE
ncbi:hypothetical protein BKA62DRAFT_717832 [Auriculariales sp. MPI-PUGE-AT-0066]|nr:hypothetical protein BKA62DRAFT_717832 [Auriculariales sp. MPI-PUGE-AT-0066]